MEEFINIGLEKNTTQQRKPLFNQIVYSVYYSKIVLPAISLFVR